MTRRAFVLAALLAILAGCGKKQDDITVNTSGGTVTAKQDGSGTTIKTSTPQGETSITSKDGNVTASRTDEKGNKSTFAAGSQVDLSKLGVKLYPGATTKDGSSVHADTPDGASTGVTLTTSDAVAKIVNFYKSEFQPETTTITPQGGVMSGTTSAGDKVVIMISKQDKGNDIGITVVRKKK